MLTPIGSGLFMIQSITTTPSVAEETTQIKLCPLRKKKTVIFMMVPILPVHVLKQKLAALAVTMRTQLVYAKSQKHLSVIQIKKKL